MVKGVKRRASEANADVVVVDAERTKPGAKKPARASIGGLSSAKEKTTRPKRRASEMVKSPVNGKKSGKEDLKVSENAAKRLKRVEADDHAASAPGAESRLAKFVGEQAEKAARALHSWNETRPRDSGKKVLFPEYEQAVQLQIAVKKPALGTAKMRRFTRIVLPHVDEPQQKSVLLIVANKDRSRAAKKEADVDRQAREWREELEAKHGIKLRDVNKIMTLDQLRREAGEKKERAALVSAFDLIAVDKTVAPRTREFFGSIAEKEGKTPFIVDLKTASLRAQLDRIRHSVMLAIHSGDTLATINIGHFGLEANQLAENARHAALAALRVWPGGSANVRCIDIRPHSGTPSLPIFYSLGSPNEVVFEKHSNKKTKNKSAAQDGASPKKEASDATDSDD